MTDQEKRLSNVALYYFVTWFYLVLNRLYDDVNEGLQGFVVHFFICFPSYYSMSSLHVWFSKLKWSMDVLLRFYERHAFICALHKETRLLFDELIFCLQRLYSVPIHIDLPFPNEALEDIALTPSSNATSVGFGTMASSPASCGSYHGCLGQKHTYDSTHGQNNHCCSNCACNDNSETSSGVGTCSGRLMVRRPSSGSSSKSRIPRPISLPKRLECKLSGVTSGTFNNRNHASPLRASPVRTNSKSRPIGGPSSGPVRPASGDRSSKSRVRDTVKLFDSKAGGGYNTVQNRASRGPATTPRRTLVSKAPKSGAGEAMALEDTGGR